MRTYFSQLLIENKMKVVAHIFGLMLICALTLSGCNTDDRIRQSKALKAEMAGSKIKRVTDAQLVATVDEWGKEITVAARRALEKSLAQNPQDSARWCGDLRQVPLIAAVDSAYGVKIQLLGSADVRNPELAPKERELLEAYLYNAERNLSAPDNVQKLNDTLLVYNAPIPLSSIICTTCYKNQKVPFAAWRVLFNKKALILKMGAKQLSR